MQPAIRVERVGKKYTVRHEGRPQYQMIREEIVSRLRGAGRMFTSRRDVDQASEQEEFWALRDIDMEVEQGQRVGIIGRNGAGKSTLLKLLCRISEPTEGRISIQGRVGSLLEVGTGFHPEMTGRENIYLNGAVLGMRRSEIQRKFDEIVAFAGTERFLDTPVKRYSSGMYVRLAFSVAAHLEPQILVVDEVLAVGDYEFQKKCLGKMEAVSKSEGRTVLFVSHNLTAIGALCNRAILLEEGHIVAESTKVELVMDRYRTRRETQRKRSSWYRENTRFDSEYFQPTFFGLIDLKGCEIGSLVRNDLKFQVLVEFSSRIADPSLVVGYIVYDHQDNVVFYSTSTDAQAEQWPPIEAGTNRFISDFPRRFLNEGTYRVELVASLYNRQWLLAPESDGPAVEFTIQGGLSDSPQWLSRRPGIVAPIIPWATTADRNIPIADTDLKYNSASLCFAEVTCDTQRCLKPFFVTGLSQKKRPLV